MLQNISRWWDIKLAMHSKYNVFPPTFSFVREYIVYCKCSGKNFRLYLRKYNFWWEDFGLILQSKMVQSLLSVMGFSSIPEILHCLLLLYLPHNQWHVPYNRSHLPLNRNKISKLFLTNEIQNKYNIKILLSNISNLVILFCSLLCYGCWMCVLLVPITSLHFVMATHWMVFIEEIENSTLICVSLVFILPTR